MNNELNGELIVEYDKLVQYMVDNYFISYETKQNNTFVSTDTVSIMDFQSYLNGVLSTSKTYFKDEFEPNPFDVEIDNIDTLYTPKAFNFFIKTFINAGWNINLKAIFKNICHIQTLLNI